MRAVLTLIATAVLSTCAIAAGPLTENGFDQSLYDSALGTFTYLDDQIWHDFMFAKDISMGAPYGAVDNVAVGAGSPLWICTVGVTTFW